jgi:hypothetical protein
MQHARPVEKEKEGDADGADDSGGRRGAWADREIRSDLAAVGLKFWGLDWESLERRPQKVGMRPGAERKEIARQEGRLGPARNVEH